MSFRSFLDLGTGHNMTPLADDIAQAEELDTDPYGDLAGILALVAVSPRVGLQKGTARILRD